MTAAEYRMLMQRKNKDANSKFQNQWTEIDGHKFQSIAEGKYYGRLKMRLKAKEIRSFEMQKTYKIFIDGVLITTYRADFVIQENDGTFTVVDVKSEATEAMEVFQIKRKLMFAVLGIKIVVAKQK